MGETLAKQGYCVDGARREDSRVCDVVWLPLFQDAFLVGFQVLEQDVNELCVCDKLSDEGLHCDLIAVDPCCVLW